MKRPIVFALLLVIGMLIVSMLACAGTPDNLRVTQLPQYICPSATPRPTDTPRPTSPPTYPMAFQANLNYSYVDVTRSTVTVQYLAQSVGSIQLNYSGMTTTGQLWSGSFSIGYAPYGAPGIIGAYPLSIPSNVNMAMLTVVGGYSYTFTVTRYPYPFYTNPNPPPCCLPLPIYPTPVPTYTPYPTPTLYVRTNDYFVGDPVYAITATLRLKFRVTAVQSLPAPPDTHGNPRSVYVWRLEVKNIGTLEYNLFPAAQMYVSEVITPTGGTMQGVWGPSLDAARAAGISPTYDPAALRPGQTMLFSLAAFGPQGTAYRISYALDLTTRGGPTQVPGTNIVSWLNRPNTDCIGEIQEP